MASAVLLDEWDKPPHSMPALQAPLLRAPSGRAVSALPDGGHFGSPASLSHRRAARPEKEFENFSAADAREMRER